MRQKIKDIFLASQWVFKNKFNFIWLLLITGAFFFLFVIIPVLTTPGDDFLFHLSIMTLENYFLMIGLSFLNAVVVVFHKYIKQVEKEHHLSVKQVSSGFGVIITTLLATLSCGACYSGVLAILGLTGALFVMEHRWWFAGLAGGITLWAINSASQKILGGCQFCKISLK